MFGKRSLFNHPILRVAAISLLGQSFVAQAVPPAWWSQGNPPVIDPIAPPDNHGMANVGQAKWMAQSALAELGNVLGSESPIVEAIREELLKAGENSTQGIFFPARPENPSQDWLANQKAPLEIGALKALAAPFYKHLSALDGSWVEARLQENGLQTLGIDYFQDADGTYFPWNPANDHSLEQNHAAATVGQLKLVFSLDFAGDFETGAFIDEIPDIWESAVVAANNNDAWTSISQINAATAVAAGSQTGAGNPPTDRDGDGVLNDEDADPDDKIIDWSPGPRPSFAMIELPVEGVDHLVLDDFTENGTVLLTRIENTSPVERIVVDKNLVAHPFAFGSGTGGSFEGYANALLGDQVPGFHLVNGSSVECLWDPLSNTFTPWQFPGNYHDDIRDDRNGVTIWNGQYGPSFPQDTEFGLRRLPGGALLPGVLSPEINGTSNAYIEKNGNIVSDLAYWRKNPFSNNYLDPVSLPMTSSSKSATLVRPLASNTSLENEWNLVASQTGLLVSKNSGPFTKATGKLGSASIYGVTKQGWAWGTQGIWVNGKWQNLKDFLGTPSPVENQMLGILDTGLAVVKIKRTADAVKNVVFLLPVEVVEVSPKTKDEDGNEIAGSEKPSTGKPLTPFVEVDPHANKIAHRELKVMIGSALKDKKVTWTLEPVPGATPANIRGQWEDSPTHKDRFEASTAYDASSFRKVSQTTGETKVGADGHTAIRVNVPPIGFNQARIKIQIEGMSTSIDLIDMEVPGVVVIDPGHGGTADMPGSSYNNAESPSGVLEKTMALNYGLAVRDALKAKRQQDKINLKVFMTRDSDVNVSGADRGHKARDNGADIIFILHFNANDDGATPHRARGTLEVYRTTNNVSPQEDTLLSNNVIDGMVAAMQAFDAAANHRARVGFDDKPAVSSDLNNGNTTEYHPVRTAYIEGEFIDFGANTADKADDAVDILLNTGPNAGAVKTAISNAIRDSILQDLRDQPQQ